MDLGTLTGPYRATKLWNHAVTLFCTEMPVYRHRRVMKYYNDCFTGAQAIVWFHKALVESPCFDQEVSKKQTQQLLAKFLKAGVFHSVKGTSQFKKSSLYEFVREDTSPPYHGNKMYRIENTSSEKDGLRENTHKKIAPLQILDENIQKINSGARGSVPSCENTYIDSQYRLCRKAASAHVLFPEDIWKKHVIERLQELLPGEEIVSKLPTINSKWVLINGSPEYGVIRKRTILPKWVAIAMCNVLYPQQNRPQNSYPSFTEDVVNTVYDYFNCLSLPLIPSEFYDIIIHIFLHLMKIDENTKRKMYTDIPFNSKSMENLLLDMSSSNLQIDTNKIKCTLLPANSCFETAFTSDVPITRIVPQSSIDTIYLAGKSVHDKYLLNLETAISRNNLHRPTSHLLKRSQSTAQPAPFHPLRRSRSTAQNICKRYISVSRHKSVRKIGSSLFVERKRPDPDKHQSYKTDGCFDNFGLSKSLDNLNSDIPELDLKQALDSLQILVDATKNHSEKEKYYSDISLSSNNSDETSSNAESDSSLDEPVRIWEKAPHRLLKYPVSVRPATKCFEGTNLLQPTLCLADSVYLFLFTLLPPECRNTVALVLKFLHHLYKQSEQPSQIFMLFSNKILRSAVMMNAGDPNLSNRVLFFLMEHNENIFTDLPKEFTTYIDSQVASLYQKVNFQENNPCKPNSARGGDEPVKLKGLRSITGKIKSLRL